MAESFVGFLKETGDRLSNPVTSTFIVAFSIWNWPVILALFAGSLDSPELRIMAVEAALEKSSYGCKLLPLFVFPAISTALYLAGMPYLRRFTTNHINRRFIEGNRTREEDFLRIIGEIRNYESVIAQAHQEIQGAYNILHSTLDRYSAALDPMPTNLEKHTIEQLDAVKRDAKDHLRRLGEVKEKFQSHYLLIQSKNQNSNLPGI